MKRILTCSPAQIWLSETIGDLGPFARKTIMFSLSCITIWLVSMFGYSLDLSAATNAFFLGMFMPGAGFLYNIDFGITPHLITITIGIVALFVASMLKWFATGDVVLPLLIWLGSALASSLYHQSSGVQTIENFAIYFGMFSIMVLSAVVAFQARFLRARPMELAQTEILSTGEMRFQHTVSLQSDRKAELDLADLQRMRLLFDRALQPLEEFNGFEWIDQFQTASVRYQLNAMSQALSIAQRVHLPAFQGYLTKSQRNLALKQQDEKVWRYWMYENAWGKLKFDRNPVPVENIMFTGFVATQISFYQAASGERIFDKDESFVCKDRKGNSFAYSLPEFTKLLSAQYRTARYGLLACEPNWVFPLCNMITASGIKACDMQHQLNQWDSFSLRFIRHLDKEFYSANGHIIPFRSTYSGLAVPPIGGAVLQTYPCLYLNTFMPERALEQWNQFRQSLNDANFEKAFWPVDVGNYKFSRASSYAASYAAAIEMGDDEMAGLLLEKLNEACPIELVDGVANRTNASLWANSVELMGAFGRQNGFYDLVNSPRTEFEELPYIKEVSYPDVLVAKAVSDQNELEAVFYPGNDTGFQKITLAGLQPLTDYQTNLGSDVRSNDAGIITINIYLAGRTDFSIKRSAH